MEEIIKVGTRRYKVLEILPRKFREHDLVLCEDLATKTKECFHRFDILAKINNERLLFPQHYKQIIFDEYKKGKTKQEIAQLLFEKEDNGKKIDTLKAYVGNVLGGRR